MTSYAIFWIATANSLCHLIALARHNVIEEYFTFHNNTPNSCSAYVLYSIWRLVLILIAITIDAQRSFSWSDSFVYTAQKPDFLLICRKQTPRGNNFFVLNLIFFTWYRCGGILIVNEIPVSFCHLHSINFFVKNSLHEIDQIKDHCQVVNEFHKIILNKFFKFAAWKMWLWQLYPRNLIGHMPSYDCVDSWLWSSGPTKTNLKCSTTRCMYFYTHKTE